MWRSTITVGRKALLRRLEAKIKAIHTPKRFSVDDGFAAANDFGRRKWWTFRLLLRRMVSLRAVGWFEGSLESSLEDIGLNVDEEHIIKVLETKFAKGKAAYEVFNKFGDFGCEPNSDTYYFTIEAVSRRKIYDWASSVSEKMLGAQKLPDAFIQGLCRPKDDGEKKAHRSEDVQRGQKSAPEYGRCRSHLQAMGSLIQLLLQLSKQGEMEEATKSLKMMEDRGLKPDVYTYTVIISGYVKKLEMDEAAEKLLEEMKGNGVHLNAITKGLIRAVKDMEQDELERKRNDS
nr:pentatricopeptide repeat-containing protein At3g02650, mitochondrial [Ipomoea batatas]